MGGLEPLLEGPLGEVVGEVAEVVGETKGEKITNVMYKRRKGMRRKSGHRQKYVTVKIAGISAG